MLYVCMPVMRAFMSVKVRRAPQVRGDASKSLDRQRQDEKRDEGAPAKQRRAAFPRDA